MAKKSKNKYQKLALDVLGTRPIAFNPDLARALGSTTAGLFLSQILYWWKKGRNPEMIYKTIKEFEEETTLSKAQQLHAQKICVARGVIEVKYKGIPPKRNFVVHMEKVLDLLRESMDEEEIQERSKRRVSRRSRETNKPSRELDFSSFITESTPQTTPQNSRTYSTSERGDASARF